MTMRPGSRVVVTAGRYEGRTAVVVAAPDADGVVSLRIEPLGDWPFPWLVSVMGRYLKVVEKADPMADVGEALV